MISLETERLCIRNFGPDDWRALQEVVVAYQASDSAQYEDPWPTSDKEVQGIAAWFAGGDEISAADAIQNYNTELSTVVDIRLSTNITFI